LAEKNTLKERLVYLLGTFQNNIELPTKEDIARLFGVKKSSVTRYLQEIITSQALKDYEALCRQQGSSRGGKNGNKAANFKSSGNS
jgi:hypothetical protein